MLLLFCFKGPLHGRQGKMRRGERTIGIYLSHSESYMLPLRFAFKDIYERDIQCSPHSMAANVTGSLLNQQRFPFSIFLFGICLEN